MFSIRHALRHGRILIGADQFFTNNIIFLNLGINAQFLILLRRGFDSRGNLRLRGEKKLSKIASGLFGGAECVSLFFGV